MGFLQEMSSGQMKFILRGIQCKCLQVMSLITGPAMSPPRCGRRGNRDGDKFLCNSFLSTKFYGFDIKLIVIGQE